METDIVKDPDLYILYTLPDIHRSLLASISIL